MGCAQSENEPEDEFEPSTHKEKETEKESKCAATMQCICGNLMEKTEGECPACNVCGTYVQKNELYYHCSDGRNMYHVDGFDLCEECASKLFESRTPLCKSPTTCFYVLHLVSVMKQYAHSAHDHEPILVIEDYLHILLNHNDDKSYEWIADQLGECDVSKCPSFSSIYRIESNSDEKQVEYTACANQQIWNKAHCYLYHGFEMRLRLRANEKHNVFENDTEHTLKSHIKRFRRGNRFNQLQYSIDENKHEGTEPAGVPIFQSGIMFIYGYKGERSEVEIVAENSKHTRHVSPVYSSLKKELLDHAVAPLTKRQYDEEYQKAIRHLNSHSCRKYITPVRSTISFVIEHMLSLMVYCNFDNLQNVFSKTYRQNDGEDHKYVYFLGKNLKIAVKMFGTQLRNGSIKKFYHGINQKLYIKHFGPLGGGAIGGMVSVCIRCPLSTSSCLPIAVQFAQSIDGMVIEFAEAISTKIFIKSFACHWLSDYPNEKEHLFIQNGLLERLQVSDIIVLSTGLSYKTILEALGILYQAITSFQATLMGGSDDLPIETKQLIIWMLYYRLSTRFDRYRKYRTDSLGNFTHDIISNFFVSQRKIFICLAFLDGDARGFGHRFSFLFHLFVDPDLEHHYCPRLDYIVTIFPKAVFLDIWDIILTDKLIQRIYQYLEDEFVRNTVEMLRIIPAIRVSVSTSEILSYKPADVVSKYNSAFNTIGYELIEKEPRRTHFVKGQYHDYNVSELEISKVSSKHRIMTASFGTAVIGNEI
eukprot:860782_1